VCQKINVYRSVSSSLFLPPSPLFVLLTSLRSARENTHAFIFCLSQIFVRPRINSHPTLIFLSQGLNRKHCSKAPKETCFTGISYSRRIAASVAEANLGLVRAHTQALTALGLTPGAHCTNIMTKVQDRRAKTASYQHKLSTKSKRKYKTKSASKAQLVAQATESCCGYQSRVRLDLGSDGVIILEVVSWLVREVERLAEEDVRCEVLEEKMAKKKLKTAQAAAAPPCKHCNQPFSTGAPAGTRHGQLSVAPATQNIKQN
jgi:hypothetical protein